MKKVSDEQIIYAYKELSTQEAIDYLGISKSTYYKRLEKLGVERNKVGKVSDEQVLEAIKNSKSIREAASTLGINHSSLHKRMRTLGIDFKNKNNKRKYVINDNAFSNINAETAYWLGFIAADGSVVGNTLRFILNKVDEETLDRFLKFCDSNYKVHYHVAHYTDNDGIVHRFDAVNLKITSNKIVADLAKYGIVQNKKNMDIPFINYIPAEYKKDFIVGFFDGDGSVTPNSNTVTIATNHSNLAGIIDELSMLDIDTRIATRDKISVIYISKKESYKRFRELYGSRKYATMQRKFNKLRSN